MSRIVFVLAVIALVAAISVPQASAGSANGKAHSFKWFRDADGDGIPNGMDEDWIRPLEDAGYQLRHGFGLFFSGFFYGATEDGNTNRIQYRHRNQQSDPTGDCIKKQNQDRICR
jgi:hypothetical protein